MRINLKNLFITVFVFAATNTFAQVGIGTDTPAASAALEVASNTNNKGILIPRITAIQKDAISNPAEGLMIYQTSAPVGFYYFTNNSWRLMVTQTDLETKVAKVSGKELSSNDYTSTEKTKLRAITGTNTGDQDLSALATIASVALKANTADVNNAMSLKANAADLISGLALKVDQVNGKELSSNDYTSAEKTKLAAITGTNTGDQDLSALATNVALALKANTSDVNTDLATKVDKVTGKVLSSNDYTSAEKTKLAGISGSNTGDQDLSELATNVALALKANTSDVNTDLAAKVDKVTGKILSSNDYTSAEKIKLAEISGSNTGDQDLSALATITSVVLKANTADVNADLALKANTAEVTNFLALKANITDVNTSLALKANTAEVTNFLALKANITDVNTDLALKANTADVTNSLALKANITDVNTDLALKANTTEVTNSLALKAPLASPSLVTPNIGAATGTSLSVTGQLTSTVVTGTAPLVVSSTTPVANLSIGGNAATATLANRVSTNANLTGDVTSSGNATTIGAAKVTNAMLAGSIDLTNKVIGVLPISKGGTGLTTAPLNGQIDIGNGTGFNRTTISAGSGISVSNAAGEITIALNEIIGYVDIGNFHQNNSLGTYNVADFKTIFLTGGNNQYSPSSLFNLTNNGRRGQVLNLVFAPTTPPFDNITLTIKPGGNIAVMSNLTFSTEYSHGGVVLIFDGRYWRVM